MNLSLSQVHSCTSSSFRRGRSATKRVSFVKDLIPLPRWAGGQPDIGKPAVLPLLPHLEGPCQRVKQDYFLGQGLKSPNLP